MVYIDRKMVYIGSGVLRRPFIHLDVTTEEDKVARAIGTARKRNVHDMLVHEKPKCSLALGGNAVKVFSSSDALPV